RARTVIAVDGIEFAIAPGQTVALLGGNGGGKTTTLSMLLGLLIPTAGTIRILGEDMVRHRYRVLPRMNFSSPYVELPHRLSVAQNMDLSAWPFRVGGRKARVAATAADLDIPALLARRAGMLSAGQKSRVALAKALLSRPDVLLLGEPTASLDPFTA